MRQKLERAIDAKIRPYLQSLGKDIALIDTAGNVASVRIRNEDNSMMRISLRAAVSMKIQELVPEVKSVDFRE